MQNPGVDLGYWGSRNNLNLQWNGRVTDSLRAAMGAEVRQDTAQSGYYFSNPQSLSQDTWRVYGNGEWKLSPNWLINFGGMLEHAYNSENQLSPRVTLNYKFDREQSFRLEYNQAYRTPTFYELLGQNSAVFPDGTIFPPNGTTEVFQTLLSNNLKPERVTSHALGWLLQMPQRGIQVDARLFYDRYDNLINNTFVSFGDGNDVIFQFQNQPDAVTLHGVEFQVEWRPGSSTRIRLTPSWASINSSSTAVEHSAPPFACAVLLDQKLGSGWRASAGYYHSGAMTWLGGTASPVSSVNRVDASIVKTTRVSGHPVEIRLTGQSLFGGQEEFNAFQKDEKRVMLGARVDF